MPHLKLDQSLVDEARARALHIAEPTIDFISKHTTVTIERSLLQEIDGLGLFSALQSGLFADIKRSLEGGRGLEGVIKRNDRYFNPFYEELLA